MALDGSNNPQTPVYTKARPIPNDGCVNCGQSNNQDFYNPSNGGGKDALVLAGKDISVDDFSDSETDIFRVNSTPTTQLQPDLVLRPFIAAEELPLPILTGRIVDQIIAEWSYNVDSIASQDITGLTVAVLQPLERTYDFTGLNVSDDTDVTLSADDGLGYTPESTGEDTETITFGNYLANGPGATLDGALFSSAQALLDAFISADTVEVRRDRNTSVYGKGIQNEKFYIMYPKAWLEATFQKGIFIGGFVRVKNVLGTLKHTLAQGEVESDIVLSNGEGHSEAFYIYETLFDNQNDAVTPIQIL